MHDVLAWIGLGLKEAGAMVWMTWWPLVLGFTLSGVVQSFLPRDGLRARLGTTSPTSVAQASVLGVISSSCSYAASAMARALFARGASWPNTLVFMVASTNLVIELGVVLYLFLGWQFVAAQFAGGAVMVAALALGAGLAFSPAMVAQLRARVLRDSPPPSNASGTTWRERVRTPRYYRRAAQFTVGDATMLRKELLAGFLIAGFLSVHVPNSWWSGIFWTGHGWLTTLENALLAPLLAVISFVCSVGNIPLAAALWRHGVAFGGVISFIFADLVTLPLLLIYRRFYGTRATLRLFLLLWVVMSGGGLVVDALFHAAHQVPGHRMTAAMNGQFPLGSTLGLNLVATLLAGVVWWGSRQRDGRGAETARDPVCGMTVDVTSPVATRQRSGETFYFCSPRCAERFDRGEVSTPTTSHDGSADHAPDDAVDPVCGMTVQRSTALSAVGPDGETHYFCASGCRDAFLDRAAPHGATLEGDAMFEDPQGDATDPVRGMTVDTATAASAPDPEGTTRYFCSMGCRDTFLAGGTLGGPTKVPLGRKPERE